MLNFLRTKITKMAPETSVPDEGSRAAHIRDQLSPLFEDNISAKIIKTAVNGLVDNVRGAPK